MICNNILRKLVYFWHLIEFAIKWTITNFQAGKSGSLACLVGKTAIVTGGNRVDPADRGVCAHFIQNGGWETGCQFHTHLLFIPATASQLVTKMICNNILRKLVYFWHLIELAIKWTITNFQAGKSGSLACLVGKTAIVTGGNRGIGYATSVLLASRGCRVIIACRSDATEAKEEIIRITSNPNITIAKLDLSSLKSIREFAEDIKSTQEKIDILINNAGVGALTEKVTEDGLNATMQTNFFGSFLLTHLLLEPLKASGKARVVFTTSGMGAIHNLTLDNLNMTNYEINFGTSKNLYCNSKLCNALAGHEFAKRLRDYHIMVNTSDTGAANTEIYKNAINATGNWGVRCFTFITIPFQRDKFDAAQTAFHLASSEKLDEETGKLYFRCKPLIYPMIINDEKFCDEIWKKTEELVGLNPEEKI